MPETEQPALPYATWQPTAQAHLKKAQQWTLPYRSRRASGTMHPSYDFIFIYFRFAPALLEGWHPGLGVTFEAPEDIEGYSEKYYTRMGNTLSLDPSKLDAKARKRLQWQLDLCRSIQRKPAQFSCYGMHEWAMVYQGGPEGRPRHEGKLPMRLSQAEIDTIVERQPTCCSHFDAFRFFTETAKPFNKLNPTQDERMQNEQPGCLHTNMDLYKWTAKAMPWVGSNLLWDTFQYAIRCREIDMRASPYDCSALGFEAIYIETESGREEYQREQRALTEAGKPLRARLIATLEALLELAPE
ncbi:MULTISPECIES: 3-methyladenine DNA glycosylase [unclassified Lentimonas]|uniref:3-methyladenine DNA glycosylase n=1 Tax=unclassified Lentimonas TaxID=2630993 RepID=UPI001327564F|nr:MULTISPECIES: 3-methyladenine DNA glycosylase [unclassified Lentimonas]CAA6676856.1 Unannotated [Lentimonas sp. CC4]CAA6686663.1 Unannotated [Lentimonas sp. CC6]CAA7075760.1 Unannotated [Lentimonas sp. CC4]CAA7168081.1 Unannotated [Lentimonas sp. CC21]CAA7181771.1 Unannotated [Lentimonas sp. CC8]